MRFILRLPFNAVTNFLNHPPRPLQTYCFFAMLLSSISSSCHISVLFLPRKRRARHCPRPTATSPVHKSLRLAAASQSRALIFLHPNTQLDPYIQPRTNAAKEGCWFVNNAPGYVPPVKRSIFTRVCTRSSIVPVNCSRTTARLAEVFLSPFSNPPKISSTKIGHHSVSMSWRSSTPARALPRLNLCQRGWEFLYHYVWIADAPCLANQHRQSRSE